MTTAPDPRDDAAEADPLLRRADEWESRSAQELLPLVYEQLHELARTRMAREPKGHTLQATALVHEAYLRLVGPSTRSSPWSGRGHFFGAAARAMRRILVERARRTRRLRHGGAMERIELSDSIALRGGSAGELDVIALDAALTKLEGLEPRKAEVVQLRHFAGLTVEETAQVLDVSPATVKSDWSFARAWLHRELST